MCNFDSNKPSNKILNDMYEKIQNFLPSCLLTYIYAYIMQQHDTSLCGLYVIAYVLDIAFKIKPKSSRYIITLMKNHTNLFFTNHLFIPYPK